LTVCVGVAVGGSGCVGVVAGAVGELVAGAVGELVAGGVEVAGAEVGGGVVWVVEGDVVGVVGDVDVGGATGEERVGAAAAVSAGAPVRGEPQPPRTAMRTADAAQAPQRTVVRVPMPPPSCPHLPRDLPPSPH